MLPLKYILTTALFTPDCVQWLGGEVVLQGKYCRRCGSCVWLTGSVRCSEGGQAPEEDPFKVGQRSRERKRVKSISGSSGSVCLARGGPEKKKILVLNNVSM